MSDDNREKLQAMELFKDSHLVKLELMSNATTIDSVLNYISSKQQEQRQKKGPTLDSTSNDDNDSSDVGEQSQGQSQSPTGIQTVF